MSCPCQSLPCFFTWNLENAPVQTPQVAFGLLHLEARGVWQCDCLLFLSFFFDVGLIYLTHNKVNPHFFGKVKTNILAAFRTIFHESKCIVPLAFGATDPCRQLMAFRSQVSEQITIIRSLVLAVSVRVSNVRKWVTFL